MILVHANFSAEKFAPDMSEDAPDGDGHLRMRWETVEIGGHPGPP